MTTSNEHNNAPAVPQGWDDDQVIRFASMILLQGNQTDSIEIRLQQFREHEKLRGSINPLLTPAVPDCEPIAWTVAGEVTNWSRDFSMYRTQHYVRPVYAATPAPAPAQGEPFGYFRAEPFGWTDCSEDAEGAIALYEHPAHEKHWTENEPVRLPSARTDRVYLAGPMTGISELNFPAFNQEAERLRAEGLQVLNPADHGIVDGADWADYLRHDIAGLASCERIHLLRGWPKSKGACLEMTIAKALGMTVTYQVDAEIEHNNAPAVPVTCGNGCDCLAQCGDAYAHAGLPKPRQAEATSQGWPFGELSDGQIMATVGRMGELVNYLKLGQQWDGICNLVRQIIRERYTLYVTPAPAPAQEAPSDPNGWCQYVAGMVFCWLQMQEGLGLTSYDEDRFVEAIAGIVQRRLWAYKPAQEVSDKHEREMLEVIDERDRINEWADQLADAIAKHTGYEIGEHTSANNPWRMALNALVCHEAKQEVGLTDDEIKQACTDIYLSDHPQGSESYDIALGRAVIAALRAKGASDAEPCTRDQARAAIAKATGATHE